MIKKNYECILISTKDKKIFTQKKNLKKLQEYCRIFKAELSVVKVKEAEILDLDQIAEMTAIDTKPLWETEYKVLKKINAK